MDQAEHDGPFEEEDEAQDGDNEGRQFSLYYPYLA